MIYKSYKDLSDCIRRNLWKVPTDVELVVGVPRSGMIAALMMAELLNVPCATLDDFAEGRTMACGERSRLMQRGATGKVLVLDDTVNRGGAMSEARKRLALLREPFTLIFGCVYARGREAKTKVDVWLEDIYSPGETWYLYEWNILHHHADKTLASMWDIDGLVCKNPPRDRNTAEYERYLSEAVPMIIPTTKVGAFVTYRLEKYRSVTEHWLRRQGIEYERLVMFQAQSREQRDGMMSPERYKAQVYRSATWARLFFESDGRQAEAIASLSGKAVFCYESGRMFCP